ncbi:VOC family protein [Streptomyces sp. NE06-03E]|uniref:VOC family protein n=1 Tax=Streptomyces sp. NE06-03E TaxID=3028695 RepID=UPI0029BC11E2|nr:VOC family protein [Streptomyces sp. NE06-03E]MDX3057764.1 VOC family protein [Streptomyces sp. NE06-03E]
MPDLLGINHLTLSTTDLDRLVRYYTGLLGAALAFERAATPSDPRIAVISVGGDDHLMIIETTTGDPDLTVRTGRPDW